MKIKTKKREKGRTVSVGQTHAQSHCLTVPTTHGQKISEEREEERKEKIVLL